MASRIRTANEESRPVSNARLRPSTLIIAIAGIILLIFIWPIGRALGQVVAGAITAHPRLTVALIFAFVAMLLVATVRVAFAWGRKIEHQADVAGVVKMQNDQPIHVLDLRQISPALLAQALDMHGRARLAEAQRPYPALTNLHQAIRIEGAEQLPAAAQLVAAPPIASLQEAIARGLSSAEQWYVGDASGQPQAIVLKHTGFIALSGVQGTGKTNTIAHLAAQAAYHGGDLLVSDIHYGDDESLSARIAPISGAVARWAATAEETNDLIVLADKIYQRRCSASSQITTTVFLIIDEFMELMIRGLISEAAMTALLALSGGGRKKKMPVALVSQNWSIKLMGPHGVVVRQNTTQALVHRSSRETAEFFLPGSYTQLAAMAQPGQLVYFAGGEPQLTTVPEVQSADLALASRGRPPRPYAARANSRSQAVAPTVPASSLPPRAAPRTTSLPPLTVREQIRELLARRGAWLTSSEIAEVLGVDVKVVRTELTPMVNSQEIQRRQSSRRGGERYEYTSQSISRPLTV